MYHLSPTLFRCLVFGVVVYFLGISVCNRNSVAVALRMGDVYKYIDNHIVKRVSGKTFSATLFKRLFGLGKAEGLGRKSNILMYSG